MKYKKGMAALLVMMLITAVLGGCAKSGGADNQPVQQETGRYVETRMDLPEELTGSTIRQIFRVEDKVHLLSAAEENGETVLEEWELSENGEFTRVTKEWLAALRFRYEEYGRLKLMQDASGTQYLYACYSDETDQFYQGHLFREAEGSALDITPQKWKQPMEDYDFYEYAEDITLMDDGTLAAFVMFTHSVDRFLAEDGSFLESLEKDYYHLENVYSFQGKLYMLVTDDNNMVSHVEVEELASKSSEDIPFSQNQSGSIFLDVLPEGDMVIACVDGIFRCESGKSDWKKLMDGSDTSFGLSSMWCTGLAALSDGSVYTLFNEDGGQILFRYQYDPEAVNVIEETLTLYTVTESYLLKEAAVLYHKQHPEVLIQIESSYPKYTREIDYDQVYQDLNTKLLAGSGPDILIMDHFDIDNYVSKGLLVDINDVVAPLEQDGSLLENITGAYLREDGSRYAVPLQFDIQLVIGRDISEEEMSSIASLADALNEKTENYLGEQTVEELVDKFYPYFVESVIVDKELDREALGQNLEYLKRIAETCGIVDRHPNDGRAYGIWDIASVGRLAFYETGGFNEAMLPISAANLVEGSYTGFEQAFIPNHQIGIYSKSNYQETAKDFLRFLLSEEVQGTDHYEGFSVNSASLESIAANDRSNYEAVTTIAMGEGGEDMFYIRDFSEEDAAKLVQLCRQVNVIAREDGKIREELILALPEYLRGDASLEETLDKIEGGLRMYLAE